MKVLTPEPKVLTAPKKILVIGNGGRENSLAWAIRKSSFVEQVWVAPGNAGTELNGDCKKIDIDVTNVSSLTKTCKQKHIDLVVIGPEGPLASGLADDLRDEGIVVFGPCAKGAQLEASKTWAKELMAEAGVPTARHWTVETETEAVNLLKELQKPLVVKADGLAAGKGVYVTTSIEETSKAIKEAFSGKFGASAKKVLLEECLEGPELSVFALCDGERFVLLPSAQDHKRLNEGDLGPNTGGMGAYSPAPLMSEEELFKLNALIFEPIINAMLKKGINYRGVIYAGLMLTKSGPKIIEFNCRFGDPECQALMPLMGKEFAEVLYACALGCLQYAPKLSISKACSACVVATVPGYPIHPRYGDRLEINIQSNSSIQLFHAGTSLDAEGKLVTSGGRVLSVVAQAADFDQAFFKVYEELKNVHFQGISYRRDIGHQIRKL